MERSASAKTTTDLDQAGSPPSDIISAISTILLGASLSDGAPQNVEIRYLRRLLSRQFPLTKAGANMAIKRSLVNILKSDGLEAIHAACNDINANFTLKQKILVYSALVTLVLADGEVEVGEKYYLEIIADGLGLSNEKFILTKLESV